MKRLAIALSLLGSLVFAQTTSVNVTYSWDPPTTGSPVDHYVVQVSYNGGTTWSDIPSTTGPITTYSFPVDVAHIVRVAAVDARGRQGPYSVPSDSFTPDAGPPGACGKPRAQTS